MSGIESLKRRADKLAPAPTKEYPTSAWDKMSPAEKRADCRKWIKVWTDHYPEDKLTEPETEALVSRLIAEADAMTPGQRQAGRTAAATMTGAELDQRAGEIMHKARQGDHDRH
jgi:hypothetical protein